MNRRTFLGIGGALAGVHFGGGTTWLIAQDATASGAVVETAGGRLRGAADRGVQIFKAIPYGAPTGGANRFLPARRAEPWTGVRDATAYGMRSWQPFRPMIPEIGD